MSELRDAERDWIAKVVTATTAKATPQDKLTAAIQAAPGEYQVYISEAREAARMLWSLYGKEGTKFERELIEDSELIPQFP